MFQMLNRIDRNVRDRVERIVRTAQAHGDAGIVAWADRAAQDALALGRLRDRDVATLERLEDTYNHDFYRNSVGDANPIYA